MTEPTITRRTLRAWLETFCVDGDMIAVTFLDNGTIVLETPTDNPARPGMCYFVEAEP